MERPRGPRVAIVTGSSKGIGRETARLFLRNGYGVVINGRDTAKLGVTQSQLDDGSGRLLSVAGDVTKEDDASHLLKSTLDRFGRLDVLINNAGISMRGRFEDTEATVFRAMFETNLVGSAVMTRAALPALRESKGSLLFISSLAGLRGFPGIAAYSAAKMGLTAFADALRVELVGSGVHVGIVYVGFTENDPDKTVFRGDGSQEAITRPARSSQTDVARAVFSAVRRRKKRAYLTVYGPLLRLAQRFFPGLLEMALRRSSKKILSMSQ
ncbi:MAG: SDR family NAD(P)-dependent oxidoreductase [Spirochaetaceae bacterium]